MKKNKSQYFWLVVSLISLIIFVALIFSSVMQTVNAEDGSSDTEAVTEIEVVTETEAETKSTTETANDELSVIESVVASVSGTSEEIAMQIEMWQEYIDKYIMPNALAVLTSISMVFAVFSKFKGIVALYKEDKDAFDAEKEEIFSQLKTDVTGIIETLTTVKETTQSTIENMPIQTIQEDITKAKEAIEAEMTSIQDFTKMFEIFLASERKLVDTSTLSVDDKKQMKKLFYEGETIAKKNQTTLAGVSDFVLATISGNETQDETEESEAVATESGTAEAEACENGEVVTV